MSGGGVTPSPTPIPTTNLATYRNVTWNGATIKALCDVYGRLLVFKDTTSERMDGVAWTDAGIDSTFDNLDQHEQDFAELIHTYGYNVGVQAMGIDNVRINIFGTVVEFSFQDGQLVPVASQWQQGDTPMFFYRTLNDGTNDVTVVCAADGKLYVIDNDSYLIKGQNGYAWSVGAAPQALVTNAGGKVTMTAYTDDDETTIVSIDGYTVVIDLDGIVTVGNIMTYDQVMRRYNVYDEKTWMVDVDGKVLKFNQGASNLAWYMQNDTWVQGTVPDVGWGSKSATQPYNSGTGTIMVNGVSYKVTPANALREYN